MNIYDGILDRIVKSFENYEEPQDNNENPYLDPTLKPLYDKIASINPDQEKYQGQEGTLAFMTDLEQDEEFMAFVLQLRHQYVQKTGYYNVEVNTNGFQLSYWPDRPEPYIYPKEKILSYKNNFYPITAGTIQDGLLELIIDAPNITRFCYGGNRTLDSVSKDEPLPGPNHFPSLVNPEKMARWVEKNPHRLNDPAGFYRDLINSHDSGLGDAILPPKDH